MKLFLSYSHSDIGLVRKLAEHLAAAGHQIWYDQQLTGGELWWNHILDHIDTCDVFIPVLSGGFSTSSACDVEVRYALAVGCPIVPIAVRNDYNPAALLPQLTEVQIQTFTTRGFGLHDEVATAVSKFSPRATQVKPRVPRPPAPLGPDRGSAWAWGHFAVLVGLGFMTLGLVALISAVTNWKVPAKRAQCKLLLLATAVVLGFAVMSSLSSTTT